MLKGDSKKSDFLLENVDGDKILKFNLIPSENSAYMYNNSDKLIAKIETHPHKSFLNKIYDEPKSWTLSIHDLSFDRALLLGFCLSIYHFQRATGSGPGA